MQPFYDPELSYEENFETGPFGAFADGVAYEQRGEPEDEILGLPVYLPFGIPAGPLINGAFVKSALDKGFDICVYKTVRTRSYPSHPHPNIVAVHPKGDLTMEMAREPLVSDRDYSDPDIGITNSFGVPSPTPDWWQEDMKAAMEHARSGQMVWGSFQATTGPGGEKAYLDDWKLGARLVAETGVPILVANLSCPNEGTSKMLCYDVARVNLVVEVIKAEIGNRPLFLKLAFFEDQTQLEKLVKLVGNKVQGLISINTIPAEVVDSQGEQALPGEGRKISGVCGSPIRWAGQAMVERLVKLKHERGMNYLVVGVGGVTQPKHYLEYRKKGADVVLSATGAMWNPYLAQQIKEENE
jgi:dihydroorotate dehydrogenase (NAD+) catalytic subunit